MVRYHTTEYSQRKITPYKDKAYISEYLQEGLGVLHIWKIISRTDEHINEFIRSDLNMPHGENTECQWRSVTVLGRRTYIFSDHHITIVQLICEASVRWVNLGSNNSDTHSWPISTESFSRPFWWVSQWYSAKGSISVIVVFNISLSRHAHSDLWTISKAQH